MIIVPDRLLLFSRAARYKRFSPIVISTFRAHGLLPSWGLAIARQESDWCPWSKNTTDAGDIARGGAWGMFQMTLQTARGLGFTGTIDELRDLQTNTGLAAQLVKELNDKWHNLADVYACYNSGKPLIRHVVGSQVRKNVARVLAFNEQLILENPSINEEPGRQWPQG